MVVLDYAHHFLLVFLMLAADRKRKKKQESDRKYRAKQKVYPEELICNESLGNFLSLLSLLPFSLQRNLPLFQE